MNVRLDDDQAAVVEARAAALGVTTAAYLARAGAGDLAGDPGVVGVAELTWRRAAAAELTGVVRHLRSIGTNLNQLVRWTNTHDELPGAPGTLTRTLARVDDAAARAAATATRLDPDAGRRRVPRGGAPDPDGPPGGAG